jgi:hypothetical protein
MGPVEHLHHPERLHAAGPGREAPLVGEAGHLRTLLVPIVVPQPRARQNLGVVMAEADRIVQVVVIVGFA